MSFVFDRIFILLPKQLIPEATIDDALDSVNHDAEIQITKRPSLIEVYLDKEGWFWNCGLIPKRPREEKVARVGAAWFTDKKERKHVRVVADIKKVKYHESNRLWPVGLEPPRLVYPGLIIHTTGYFVTCKCGKNGFLDDLDWDGQRCWVCQEKARYEQETGFQSFERKS